MVEQKLSNQPTSPIRLLDVKSDIVFKKIFGQHPKLIKSFLNSILPLAEGHLIDKVSYLTPEQSPRIPSMKNTIVDVKCTDQKGRIFIVEMQLAWHSSFTKRFLFGAAKAFVQQIDKGTSYSSLCPVYGLAILNEDLEKDTQEWFHHYRFTHTQKPDKYLEGIELIFIELQKFKPQTFAHKKMGVLWLRFLREINEKLLVIPPEFTSEPDLATALELAQESAYSRVELELYDQYLDAIRVEQTVREDSYVAGITKGRAEGEAKGRVEGITEGEAKGRAEGKAVATIEIARKLLQDGMELTTVAKFTGLTENELKELALTRT